MTVSKTDHQRLVKMVLEVLEGGAHIHPAMLRARALAISPLVELVDFRAANKDAIAIFKKRLAEEELELKKLEKLRPIFDGMPEGIAFIDCAKIKAGRGDPLAIDYCKREGVPYERA